MTDDTISRQTAIKAIEDLQDCYNGFSDTYDKACIIGVLEELPSAQPDVPERNVGKWIKVGDNSYMCSVCGEVSCCNGNFCPDCGADMIERRTDERSD